MNVVHLPVKREVHRIGSVLVDLARHGLPANIARARLMAAGLSEAAADALTESAARNLGVSHAL